LIEVVDVLILALRLLIVALLYLFVVVVLRTAMASLRPTPALKSRGDAAEQRLHLLVVEPGSSALSSGEILEIPPGATLGRSDRADVVLADTAVSSEHARVDRVGHSWVVTDLGSTNGTRVNDATITGRTRLAEGDVLSLGTVRVQVLAH
jgi:pSer/pThr/pTyr-binding forkhead associated (FHA) protein